MFQSRRRRRRKHTKCWPVYVCMRVFSYMLLSHHPFKRDLSKSLHNFYQVVYKFNVNHENEFVYRNFVFCLHIHIYHRFLSCLKMEPHFAHMFKSVNISIVTNMFSTRLRSHRIVSLVHYKVHTIIVNGECKCKLFLVLFSF